MTANSSSVGDLSQFYMRKAYKEPFGSSLSQRIPLKTGHAGFDASKQLQILCWDAILASGPRHQPQECAWQSSSVSHCKFILARKGFEREILHCFSPNQGLLLERMAEFAGQERKPSFPPISKQSEQHNTLLPLNGAKSQAVRGTCWRLDEKNFSPLYQTPNYACNHPLIPWETTSLRNPR